jgi:septum formation protein
VNEQLILASASPRRKELLDQIGVRYIVHPVDIDEAPKHRELALDYVCRVAAEKSAACVSELMDFLPVLAADTSVVLDGQIMGKPKNREHAMTMLNQLSGKTHSVYSAISLRSQCENRHFQVLSKTEVRFRIISPEEIQSYWDTGEPEGKAKQGIKIIR